MKLKNSKFICFMIAFVMMLSFSIAVTASEQFSVQDPDEDFVVPSQKEIDLLRNDKHLSGKANSNGTLSISRTKLLLYVQEATKLTVIGAKEAPIWSSSDRNIARVTGTGSVRGYNPGVALIQARIG